MKNIITIQHTQSLQHINGMIGSWRDWDLTDLGVLQAQRIGERLCEEIRQEDYVMYCSDLLRARHTAEIVAGYLGIKPRVTKALREFNLGEAVGKSKEWARQNPRCALWPQRIDWAVDPDGRPFAGAESRREVWNRLTDFCDGLLAGEEENLILVSHDGALSLFYAIWMGLGLEALQTCCLSGCAGGVSFLKEDAAHNRILCRLNDLSYVRAR